jgi:mannosyltransferase OCH1-like enzyme
MSHLPYIWHTFWDTGVKGMPEDIRQLYWGIFDMSPKVLPFLWDKENIKELGLDYDDLLKRYINNAGVSNVVRLHALYKEGGLWLDADFKAHKPLYPLFELGDAAAEQEPGRLCNAAMTAASGSKWIQHQLSTFHRYTGVNAYGGVDNLNDAPRDGLTVIPDGWVFSYRWDTPMEQRSVHPDAIVEHLWAGTWLPNKH